MKGCDEALIIKGKEPHVAPLLTRRPKRDFNLAFSICRHSSAILPTFVNDIADEGQQMHIQPLNLQKSTSASQNLHRNSLSMNKMDAESQLQVNALNVLAVESAADQEYLFKRENAPITYLKREIKDLLPTIVW